MRPVHTERGIDTGAALLAGLSGGMTISLLLLLARRTGWTADLEMAIGVSLASDAAAWITGLATHLIVSAAAALVYARLFHAGAPATPATGTLIGIAHAWVVAMLTILLAAWPIGPAAGVPLGGTATADGDAAYFDTVGLALYWASHLLYGAVVGTLYPLAHRAARAVA